MYKLLNSMDCGIVITESRNNNTFSEQFYHAFLTSQKNYGFLF